MRTDPPKTYREIPRLQLRISLIEKPWVPVKVISAGGNGLRK